MNKHPRELPQNRPVTATGMSSFDGDAASDEMLSVLQVASAKYLSSLLLLMLVGCGTSAGMTDYSSLNLVPVSGCVTLDGHPMSAVTVVLESEDGTWSSGRTDDNGYYRMQFNSEVEGVTRGRKIVRIYDSSNRENRDEDSSGDSHSVKAKNEGSNRTGNLTLVPQRYGHRSGMTADIDSGMGELNFELRSDGGVSE